jgi:hypothetical protein
VRPRKTVASATLTVALAMVALPALAGSGTPGQGAIDSAAFRPVNVMARNARDPITIGPLDPALTSAGRLADDTAFEEPGNAPVVRARRAAAAQPASKPGSALKPPRYKISGYATFYGNGTTAMRLPRGTTIVVCGGGGCVERVVNDYGPHAVNGRIIDLYTPDFFSICGCPSWSGTTWVTVSVY